MCLFKRKPLEIVWSSPCTMNETRDGVIVRDNIKGYIVWSSPCTMNETRDGVIVRDNIKGYIVLKANKRGKYELYTTDGKDKEPRLLEWLVLEYPDVKPLLKEYNIKY